MSMLYWITGLAVGAVFGLGLALRLTVYYIMRSNDYGDSSGTCWDFGEGMHLIVEDDELTVKRNSQSAKEILEQRKEAVLEHETGKKTGTGTV